jgi:GNAT superfamily N-acetyltransferase
MAAATAEATAAVAAAEIDDAKPEGHHVSTVAMSLIRTARIDERAALIELQRRASLANEGDRAMVLANPDIIDIPLAQFEEGCVLVAERNGAVIGLAVVLPRDDGEAELDGLFVEPSAWRQGIGRHLVDAACAHAAKRGATALQVIANPHAGTFYDSCGFKPVGEVKLQFGTGLAMRKPLS